VKIEGTNKGLPTPQPGENRARPADNNPPAAGGGEKVELSSLSASLAKAESAMAASPTVDRARVDEIRQAISEGRFRIDANRIADGLLDSVREMLGRAK
jgi:negative regulator of flagellin synthesis FlgM